MRSCGVAVAALSLLSAACQQDTPQSAEVAAPAATTTDSGSEMVAFHNATFFTGTMPTVAGTLLVENGRVYELLSGPPPPDVRAVDLGGGFVMPGLINVHGHVNGYWADETTVDEAERVRDTLRLYARYGVTTVVSLGGEPDAAFEIGDSINPAALDHARFYLAGEVIADRTAEAARASALANVERGVDWLKLRVDDNLGRGEKMPWEAVAAVLEVGKAAGIPVATHVFYLDDAERLLNMGSGMIAHSVRDVPVSDAFVNTLEQTGTCYVPTLTREVSTFAYAERPAFFDDEFFNRHAVRREVERLSDPELRRQVGESETAAGYRQALTQAEENLRTLLHESRAVIALGTDSGPPGRFPGYFEHLELEMMVAAAELSPMAALMSATSVAAECAGLEDVGTLESGKWADFIVLDRHPIDEDDITATRSLRRVFIAGNEVPR